jgi:hypothetical protein
VVGRPVAQEFGREETADSKGCMIRRQYHSRLEVHFLACKLLAFVALDLSNVSL